MVPVRPLMWPVDSLRVIPEVSMPSIAMMTSPDLIPALNAGEPTSGLMMVRRLLTGSSSTNTPMPTKPWSICSWNCWYSSGGE